MPELTPADLAAIRERDRLSQGEDTGPYDDETVRRIYLADCASIEDRHRMLAHIDALSAALAERDGVIAGLRVEVARWRMLANDE